jgi:4-carboxymuconolactone decarboxylase
MFNIPMSSASENTAAASLQIQAREALILGRPPRIGPLDLMGNPEAAVESTERIRQAVGSTRPVTASTIPELVATLMRHPGVFEGIANMSVQLQGNGVLAPRDRQLAILRTTWLCKAPYAWGEHVQHSKRIGLTSEEIERVTGPASSGGWNEHEAAVLRAVEELHADAMIADPTWAALSNRWNEQQLIELPVLVGQFTVTCYLQNSLRMRLSEGNDGLRAR